MSLLLPELERIIAEQYDIVTLAEVLDITPEELAEAFRDRIEEKFDYFVSQLELDDGISEI